MIYLLDSNACIAFMRKKSAKLSQRIHACAQGDIALCSIVLAELLYGVWHSSPAHQSGNLLIVSRLRLRFNSVAFTDPAAEEYGVLRADLVARGLVIGSNDMLIAAIALANDLTLVTNNTAEFGRIRGLRIEDWQTP